MTDRPMIFSAPMVRALMAGRKTQTRRVIKLNGYLPDFCGGRGDREDPTCWGWEDPEHGDWVTLEKDPGQRMGWRDWRGAYRPGDRLWTREAHAFVPVSAYRNSLFVEQRPDPCDPIRAAIYREGFDRSTGSIRWRPSIHMPRWASRLTLLVTDVRVQRLQEISEADAVAEGVDAVSMDDVPRQAALSRRSDFAALWNSLHGPDAWDANPWCAAISFTVHRCNIDQMEATHA